MNSQEQKKWNELIQKATEDKALRKNLLVDPISVLEGNGLQPPPGLEIKVVENTTDTLYMVLPFVASDELSDADLERTAGGASTIATRTGNDPAPWLRT